MPSDPETAALPDFKLSSHWLHLVAILVFVTVFIACYHRVLFWMYQRFTGADSYYSHGFLIPFISAYFIWERRGDLRQMEIVPTWWGLVLIGFSLLLHLAGTVLYVFSLSGFSIFFLILGISLFIFGKVITRAILFPLLFLAFMFPLPEAFILTLAFPLKMLVAQLGAVAVSLLGIPIFREGFNITIPGGSLLVGNPCSGLRSLMAFLALGAVFGYMARLSIPRTIVLFLSAIPIAVASNVVRVVLLILVSHYWGINAATPDTYLHDASGIMVFALGMVMMLLVGRLLKWVN